MSPCSLEQGAGWLSTDTVLKGMSLPESLRGQATAQWDSSTIVGEEPPFFLKNSCTEAASDSGPTYQGPGKEGRAEQEKLKGKED